MLDYLVGLIARIGNWGYLVIFLGAALESAAFLGVFVPGESLVLVTGFLAAQGLLDLDASVWAVAIGAVIGDSAGYEMGRRLGRPALLHYGQYFGLNQARVDGCDAFFKRHGGKSIFLGRFVGFACALVPFLAGASRMKYRVFLPYNILGAGLWALVVVLIGYFVGTGWRRAERWIGVASAILGAMVAFGIFLLWLSRKEVRETAVQTQWHAFQKRPGMVTPRRRHALKIAFIQARFSPGSYFGLYLTISALAFVGAGWLFGGIAEDVLTGDPLTVVDVQVAEWLHRHATPVITQIMLVVSQFSGPLAIFTYIVLVSLYFAFRRYWYWVLSTIVTVPTGFLLNVLMKFAFQRTRPSFEHPILTLTGYSFPSGHAAGSTLFFGVLAAFLVSKADSWPQRAALVVSAIVLVLLVSFSRLYLGVHFLSDVVAGIAEGIAWLSICMVSIHTYWIYRTRASGPGSV